ncbi:MAG: hypothetical protein RMI30_01405 [Thermodesulfovibrio sp.]|nr:nucleotidyltransferase family protein [Thermodesulfovibrio sp.]MDW7998101.1 hypothetical protein [Thermodesulfovibrio sp.]
MKNFKRLFSALSRGGVKYLVCGGIAINLYGIERATADIDIAISLDKENIDRFIKVMEKLGFKPKIPVQLQDLRDPQKRKEWIIEKGMIVFSLYNDKIPFFLLDVFIEPQFDFNDAYTRRKNIKFGAIEIPLVPIDVIIQMKEKTKRPQDKADLFYLRKIMKEWQD